LKKQVIFIDCGTENLRICSANEGVIFDGPSCVLFSDKTGEIHYGQQARELRSSLPENTHIIETVRNGVVADYRILNESIGSILKSSIGRSIFNKPHIVFRALHF